MNELLSAFKELKAIYMNVNEDGEPVASITEILSVWDKLEESVKAQQNWVSVKDRFPDTGHLGVANVLCVVKGYLIYILDFVNDAGQQKFYLNSRNVFENWTEYVTHWMPLPEPPKEH